MWDLYSRFDGIYRLRIEFEFVALIRTHRGAVGWNPVIDDDVIKWKHFPRNWPFVRGIHR